MGRARDNDGSLHSFNWLYECVYGLSALTVEVCFLGNGPTAEKMKVLLIEDTLMTGRWKN